MLPEQLIGWQLYYAKNPFGESIRQMQLATIAYLIWCSNRSEDDEELTIKDFMPISLDLDEVVQGLDDDEDPELEEMAAQQMLASFMSRMGDRMITL